MLRNISLALLIILYVAAGVNHFLNPRFYESIMPAYLPQPRMLVYLSGIAEIGLGLLLLFGPARFWASRLIAIMLVLFIPVHIYMLQQACTIPGYRTSVPAAIVRLLLQPLLIAWVLWQGKTKSGTPLPVDRGIA